MTIKTFNSKTNELNAKFDGTTTLVEEFREIVSDMKLKFDSDYIEFVRDRKRWKGDFDNAANKATNNFQQIESLLGSCLKE